MIHTNIDDRTLIVSLDSGKGNLLSLEDVDSLINIFSNTVIENEIDGVLVTGEGRCFTTGLRATELDRDQRTMLFEKFDRLLIILFGFPKPLVVALSGHSIGGGLLIQAAADYVVAADSDRIKLGLPEVKIGLTIDSLMVALMEYNLPDSRTLHRMLMDGEYFTVHQALELNLIDRITTSEELLTVAKMEIDKLQAHKPSAFLITKRNLRRPTIERMMAELNNRCFEDFHAV